MCSGIKKLLDQVVKAIRKVWDVVRKYFAFIVFIAVVFWPWTLLLAEMYLPAAWYATLATVLPASLSGWALSTIAWRAVIGFALAYVFSTDAAAEILETVKDVASAVVDAAGEVVGTVGGSVIRTALKNPFVLAALGFGLFFLLSKDDDEAEDAVVADALPPPTDEGWGPPRDTWGVRVV